MQKNNTNQSAWGRGWEDTVRIWASWVFIVVNVAISLLGGLFSWLWYIGVGIFICVMFCVWLGATSTAPLKQRNEARILAHSLNDTIESLKTSRLEVSLPNCDVYDHGTWFEEWHRVRVYNPTSAPITNCYGRLVEFNSSKPYPNLPRPGIMFSWSSYGANGKLSTLGSEEEDFLDTIFFDGNRIALPIFDENISKRDVTRYALLIDDYDFSIQIGSKDGCFPPNKIKIVIKHEVVNYKPVLNIRLENID